MSFKQRQLKNFPVEVVTKMMEYQFKQGNPSNVKVFQTKSDSDGDEGGFDWDLTPEGAKFWGKVILNEDFNLFKQYYSNQTTNHSETVYRMNREGVFSPSKHTDNQCGVKGTKHYSYLLTIVVKNQLDYQGFIIDHNLLDETIQKTKVYGSCEEMQRIIFKAIQKVLPDNILLGYKCVIKPIDFNSKAFIEYVHCSENTYLTLL